MFYKKLNCRIHQNVQREIKLTYSGYTVLNIFQGDNNTIQFSHKQKISKLSKII